MLVAIPEQWWDPASRTRVDHFAQRMRTIKQAFNAAHTALPHLVHARLAFLDILPNTLTNLAFLYTALYSGTYKAFIVQPASTWRWNVGRARMTATRRKQQRRRCTRFHYYLWIPHAPRRARSPRTFSALLARCTLRFWTRMPILPLKTTFR